MKLKIIIFIIGLLPIILMSCVSSEVADSKDVSQDQIFTKYYITVNAEEKKAYTEAVFRFGGPKGTSLVLNSPSDIIVNSKSLRGDEKVFTGYHYSLNIQIPQDNKYILVFKDYKEKIYSNQFYISPIAIPNFPSAISKNSDITFEFSGNPIAENEYVNLIIVDTAGLNVTITTDIKDAQMIKLPSEKLKNLKTGPCSFQIERVLSVNVLKCPKIGGLFEGKYISRIYKASLTE